MTKNELTNSKTLELLRGLEDHLKSKIVGQQHVIPRIAEVLRQGELKLPAHQELKGCFFFLGPTGVGKTETTKTFAKYLCGNDKFFSLDMADFKHRDSIVNLIGDHSGRVGRLGEILKKHNSGVILFDEIEKAHPDIRDLFLAIADEARITVGDGQTYDLSQFYIVLTSNIGSRRIVEARLTPFDTIESYVIREVGKEFRPELIRRFRNMLVFDKLTLADQTAICKMLVEKEIERFNSEQYGFSLTYNDDILHFLLERGYDDTYGARNLRNVVQFMIRSAISSQLIDGITPKGSLIKCVEKQTLRIAA